MVLAALLDLASDRVPVATLEYPLRVDLIANTRNSLTVSLAAS